MLKVTTSGLVETDSHSRLSCCCPSARQTDGRTERQTVSVSRVSGVAVGGLVYIHKQEMHNQNIQTNQSCTHWGRHDGSAAGCYGNGGGRWRGVREYGGEGMEVGRGLDGGSSGLLKRQKNPKKNGCHRKHESSWQRYTGTPPNCPWKNTHTHTHTGRRH